VRRPRGWIFDGELTICVLVSPNLIQRSLPLPGCAYAMLELSWQLCVHPRLSPMTDSDGTDSSTRVHVVWHVWAPMATSHRARQKMPSLPEAPRGSTGRPGLSWVEEGGRTGRQGSHPVPQPNWGTVCPRGTSIGYNPCVRSSGSCYEKGS
jgi:hypothetical protein